MGEFVNELHSNSQSKTHHIVGKLKGLDKACINLRYHNMIFLKNKVEEGYNTIWAKYIREQAEWIMETRQVIDTTLWFLLQFLPSDSCLNFCFGLSWWWTVTTCIICNIILCNKLFPPQVSFHRDFLAQQCGSQPIWQTVGEWFYFPSCGHCRFGSSFPYWSHHQH